MPVGLALAPESTVELVALDAAFAPVLELVELDAAFARAGSGSRPRANAAASVSAVGLG